MLWDPEKNGNVPSVRYLITRSQQQKGKLITRVSQTFGREDKWEKQRELGLSKLSTAW